MLEQWAEFYHLALSQLQSTHPHVPSLVTIRTAFGDIITYPTMLIFVPTDTKLSPSALSGLNGIMGLNRGLTEDLGSKVSRSAYHETLKSMHSTIDYWSYRDPIIFASHTVISALSMADTSYQQDQVLLHRALIEPVISSPIMNSKSVIPINTTPLLGGYNLFGNYSDQTPPKSSLSSNMNLTEFATSRFQTDELLDGLNPLNDPNIDISSDKSLLDESHLSNIMQSNLTMNTVAAVSDETTAALDPTIISSDDNPNLYNLDGMWNDNEDFGDLDVDVTEADFDFFETPAPMVTPDNVLHIMPIDVEPTDHSSQVSRNADLTPNTDSLFTPFVISNTNSEDVSTEESMAEPVGSTAAIDYLHTTCKKPANVQQQKGMFEHTNVVPRDFLPVPINTSDIDAKYEPGGKFMYDPSKETSKRELYSPDYIPNIKKRDIQSSPVKQEGTSQDVEMMDVQEGSSGSDSSGSSSSCCTDSDTDSISPDQIVDRRLRAFKKFQKSVVHSLLRATPAPSPMDRFQNMDYDSPFTPILAEGIKPIKWRHSKAMEKSMDYLCQQAILGGYPFASGLAEVSANGGEIEAESAKVMVARRTNIMQMTRGVVTHVPSLQTDTLTMEFKNMLKHIFLDSGASDAMMDKEEDMVLHPMSYLSGPLLGSIDVKGPLTIQQYYNLCGKANNI